MLLDNLHQYAASPPRQHFRICDLLDLLQLPLSSDLHMCALNACHCKQRWHGLDLLLKSCAWCPPMLYRMCALLLSRPPAVS